MDRRVTSTTPPVTTSSSRGTSLAEVEFACIGAIPDRTPDPSVSAAWLSPDRDLTIVALRAFNAWNAYHDLLFAVHVLTQAAVTTVSSLVRHTQEPARGFTGAGFALGWQRTPLDMDVPASSLVWIESHYDLTSSFSENLLFEERPNDALYGTNLGSWSATGAVLVLDSTTASHNSAGKVLRITPSAPSPAVKDGQGVVVVAIGWFTNYPNPLFSYQLSMWFMSLGSDRSVTVTAIPNAGSDGPPAATASSTIPNDGAWHQIVLSISAATMVSLELAGYDNIYARIDIANGGDTTPILMSDYQVNAIESGWRMGQSVSVALELQ